MQSFTALLRTRVLVQVCALRMWMQLCAATRNKWRIVVYLGVAALLVLCRHIYLTPDSIGSALFAPKHDVYADTSFCSPRDNGTCGEEPDQPSPRTVYSAKSQGQYDKWWTYQAALNASAAEYASRLAAAPDRGDDPLIMLGDSITESLLGTELGSTNERWDGIPEAFAEVYVGYDPLVLGMSGDQAQHLLWRLMHGNLLTEYATRRRAMFVVLIGTNNLGSGHSPDEATRGVMSVVKYLMENIEGRVVILEVLPRGDGHRLERLCPPRCDDDGGPFKSFWPAVEKVNAALRDQIPIVLKEYDGRIRLVDCGNIFAPDAEAEARGEEVDLSLMPDRLHPNAAGHKAMAECVLDCIENGVCG